MPRRDGGRGSRNRQGEPWDCSAGWAPLNGQEKEDPVEKPLSAAPLKGGLSRPTVPAESAHGECFLGPTEQAGPSTPARLCRWRALTGKRGLGSDVAELTWAAAGGRQRADARLGRGSPLKEVRAVHLQVYPAHSGRQTLSCGFRNLAHTMCSNHSKSYSFFGRTIW